MSEPLGKLEDVVTATVASIGLAARKLNVLSWAGAIRTKEEIGVFPAGLLTVPGAKVNIKARMSRSEEDNMLFGLGGEAEENQVDVNIEIPIELQSLDEEIRSILAGKTDNDTSRVIVKYKLTKFLPTKESDFEDPEG